MPLLDTSFYKGKNTRVFVSEPSATASAPTAFEVTFSGSESIGDEVVAVDAIPQAMYEGQELIYVASGNKVTTGADAAAGATSITIGTLNNDVAVGDILWYGSYPMLATATASSGSSVAVSVERVPVAISSGSTIHQAPTQRIILAADAAASATSLSVQPLTAAVASSGYCLGVPLVRVIGGTQAPFANTENVNTLSTTTFETASTVVWDDADVQTAGWNIAWQGNFKPDQEGYHRVELVGGERNKGQELWLSHHITDDNGNLLKVRQGRVKVSGYNEPTTADGILTAAWTFLGQGQYSEQNLVITG